MGTRGQPPVVFLHGFSDGGLTWLRFARDLGPEYDRVMLDAAGHGKSPRSSISGSTARSWSATRWELAPPRPPTLGADPNATGSRAPLRSPAWVEWVRSVKAMSPAERHAHADAERPQYDPETRHNWIDIKAQFNLAVLDATPAGAMRTPPPWRDTVKAITCPILLVTGDPSRGGIVTPAVAEEAKRLARDLRVATVPDVGHNIHRDNYEPYREAVAAFLREVLA
jgi:pimeloyl-ACP methyl ester carboxylesterase